jgi:sulfur carrier protein ThiS adenylyltransferase
VATDDGPTCRLPIPVDDDPAARARLADSHVAIVGCGGLGSNAAHMLVRAGIGQLTLIDFDTVEADNLNRQLFFPDQIGQPKTEALAVTLRRIRPDVRLTLHQTCVTQENAAELAGDADVIIEAADRPDVKAMLVATLLDALPGVPLVAASGLAGFGSANEIATERVGDDFYLVGDLASDIRDGLPLMASRVMVAAAHEAHAAIRVLLGHTEA